MNAPKKPHGRPGSELTRFKLMWRDTMAESARDYWRSLWSSDTSQAEVRRELKARLKINFTRDDQVKAMRDWDWEQRMMDLEAERAEEEERRLQEAHPRWTKDQVREDLLKRFYNRALAKGDAELGLKTVAADAKLESLQFNREKFKESLRSKLEAGLAELAQHIKVNAKAKAAYEALKLEVKVATE